MTTLTPDAQADGGHPMQLATGAQGYGRELLRKDRRGAPLCFPWSRVSLVSPTGCWIWLGRRSSSGYGQIVTSGKRQGVHRYLYEALIGPIAPRLVIDHLCRTPLCVNPYHLEPVSDRVNILRGVGLSAANYKKASCKRGHRLDAANTYLYRARDGGYERHCRACGRQTAREIYWRKANAIIS